MDELIKAWQEYKQAGEKFTAKMNEFNRTMRDMTAACEAFGKSHSETMRLMLAEVKKMVERN